MHWKENGSRRARWATDTLSAPSPASTRVGTWTVTVTVTVTAAVARTMWIPGSISMAVDRRNSKRGTDRKTRRGRGNGRRGRSGRGGERRKWWRWWWWWWNGWSDVLYATPSPWLVLLWSRVLLWVLSWGWTCEINNRTPLLFCHIVRQEESHCWWLELTVRRKTRGGSVLQLMMPNEEKGKVKK